MITYRIEVTDPQSHVFRISLRASEPAAEQRLSLPVWVPGSYLVREFSRHLSGLVATQHSAPVRLEQVDKASWIAHCSGRDELCVDYTVYAFDASVRAAFLDAQRGFFNGTSLLLRVEGHEDRVHRIELQELPADWQVATALAPLQIDAAGRGSYGAANYDELVDHPVELGRFWRGEFVASGVPHDFVVAGALPDFDGERLLADAKRICEAEIALWHPGAVHDGGAAAAPAAASAMPSTASSLASPAASSAGVPADVPPDRPPFERYLFLLNAVILAGFLRKWFRELVEGESVHDTQSELRG